MKVFFSHASEDKPAVEQVFVRVREQFPEVRGWLDKHEIVGGNDLIERIAAGIDEADKFLVFLSETSIKKPWVKTELRKALMAEIEGVKPEFVIPVKLGAISQMPPFLESKYYIDLETLTEEEWLREIHAAVTGLRAPDGSPNEPNLAVTREPVSDEPLATAVLFSARYWAEPISFRITTNAPIEMHNYQLLPPQRGGTLSYAVQESDHAYAVALPNHRLSPSQAFVMMMKFAAGTDLMSVIGSVDRWDGSESTQSGMAFLT